VLTGGCDFVVMERRKARRQRIQAIVKDHVALLRAMAVGDPTGISEQEKVDVVDVVARLGSCLLCQYLLLLLLLHCPPAP